MTSILDSIIVKKREEIVLSKKNRPIAVLKDELSAELFETRGFKYHIQNSVNKVAVIAEIKRRSPSKGILNEKLDAKDVAKTYKEGGADAISVLTESSFFGGSLNDLKEVRKVVDLPLLRKDFIVDEYQIYESLLCGADAILLICSALSPQEVKHFYEIASSIGLDVLIEVHTADELKKALECSNAILGINNRNLSTFEVDISVTEKLASLCPDNRILISESGISSTSDMNRIHACGCVGVLVGESLVINNNPKKALEDLTSYEP